MANTSSHPHSRPDSTIDPRRLLPAVDALAANLDTAPAALQLFAARTTLNQCRTQLSKKKTHTISTEAMLAQLPIKANLILERLRGPALPTVINATGTVLHTGLGRAALSQTAQKSAIRALNGYCQLELDLDSGKRGNRQDHVASMLCALTGAESALVVNNCAAATVLMLQALAQHQEVIVSRGELVEIGGSFRIPEIMSSAGCTLVEVGATNKTHAKDFTTAIGSNTALLLKVHRSNFEQNGFVADVSTSVLAEIAEDKNILLAVDQGSGCIFDLQKFDYKTPLVSQELQAGADIVACSGDKLLGGPQAGILLGRKDIIDQCARHPLARALRCDKITLAALAGTLQDYLFADPQEKIPTLRMLCADQETVRVRAEKIRERIHIHASSQSSCTYTVIESQGAVGSGALPTDGPPSICLVPDIKNPEHGHRQLRTGSPAVLARIHNQQLYIDCACVDDSEIDQLAARLSELHNE